MLVTSLGMFDPLTLVITFTSNVTAIHASPDLAITVDGNPVSVTNTAINAGRLLVTLDTPVDFRAVAVTYNPDGALGFANGGDVPITATYTIPALAGVPIRVASVTDAHHISIVYQFALSEYDGGTAGFSVKVNGANAAVTAAVEQGDGSMLLTITPNLVGNIEVTHNAIDASNWTWNNLYYLLPTPRVITFTDVDPYVDPAPFQT